MKAYLINMHLLVPRSSSSAKVKVKYKGYISQKMAVSGAFVFHKHILFFFYLCIFQVDVLSWKKGVSYKIPIFPSVRPKPFLHNPSTTLNKTSYMNSLGYCADVFSLVFQFDALVMVKGGLMQHSKFLLLRLCFCQNFQKVHGYILH